MEGDDADIDETNKVQNIMSKIETNNILYVINDEMALISNTNSNANTIVIINIKYNCTLYSISCPLLLNDRDLFVWKVNFNIIIVI